MDLTVLCVGSKSYEADGLFHSASQKGLLCLLHVLCCQFTCCKPTHPVYLPVSV